MRSMFLLKYHVSLKRLNRFNFYTYYCFTTPMTHSHTSSQWIAVPSSSPSPKYDTIFISFACLLGGRRCGTPFWSIHFFAKILSCPCSILHNEHNNKPKRRQSQQRAAYTVRPQLATMKSCLAYKALYIGKQQQRRWRQQHLLSGTSYRLRNNFYLFIYVILSILDTFLPAAHTHEL